MQDVDFITNLAAELSADATTPFGAYVFAADDPRSQLSRSVEEAVFGEFFGNSPELLAAEYGSYERATVFSCIVDHRRRRPAATMRLIFDSPAGFKSLDDIERGPWQQPVADVLQRTGLVLEPARTVDIATAAVSPEYRGLRSRGLVTLAMNQVTARLSLLCGIRWWVTILDLRALQLFQRSLHELMRFYHGVEPMAYLDSPLSVPVYCDIEWWCRRMARVDPALHGVLVHGEGIGEVVSHFDLCEASRAVARVGYRLEREAA
jgi:hypothetical protein